LWAIKNFAPLLLLLDSGQVAHFKPQRLDSPDKRPSLKMFKNRSLTHNRPRSQSSLHIGQT